MAVFKIGVLADTHGLLRDEVLKVLQGSCAILHAGDINRQDILDTLQRIAPVYVVRGNNDKDWAEQIPYVLEFDLCGLKICMSHKKKDLPKDCTGFDLVVCGHTHRYEESSLGNTLFLNPGSCGPRRFNQEITLAVLTITDDQQIQVQKILIEHAKPFKMPLNRRDGRDAGTKQDIPVQTERDIKADIVRVMALVKKGRSVEEIAKALSMEQELAEQICRLYLTHPGVDADGIMTKMGL